jgi:hypothetical protein
VLLVGLRPPEALKPTTFKVGRGILLRKESERGSGQEGANGEPRAVSRWRMR